MVGDKTRRRFVQELSIAAVAVSLAGCSGGGDGDGGGGDTPAATDTPTATPTPTDTATPTPEPTPTATPTPTETGGANSEVSAYLSDANNYDGTIVDKTGQGEVTVSVGAGGSGGPYAFGPAAIRVDPGTSVVWEWTGNGGSHNVVATEGAFDSGSPASGSDVTFEYTFDESGTWLYFCVPHRSLGMKGAVVVG